MSFTAKEMSDMQSQARHVLDNRPSVFRIGFIVLLLRFISSLLSIVLYLLGFAMMFDLLPVNIKIYVGINDHEIPHLWLGVGVIGLGILLNTITRLCRGMRNRNWYIIHSYDVLEWASKFPIEVENTDPIPHEKDCIISSDGNILLTTHRLVDRTDIIDRQVMLKDILSCEVLYRKQTYYKALTWIFLFIFIATFLMVLIYNKNCAAIPVDDALTYLSVPALFLILSIYSLFAFTHTHLRVTGKFRMMDLDIHAFKRDTIKQFIAELKLQSGNRKKEQ